MQEERKDVNQQMSLLLIGSLPVFFKRVEGHYTRASSLEITEAEINEENVA